jgi:hypothetical protein
VFPTDGTYEYRFSTHIPNAGLSYPTSGDPTSVAGSTQQSADGKTPDQYDHTFLQTYMKSMELPSTSAEFEITYLNGGSPINASGEFVVDAGQEVYLESAISNPDVIHVDARLRTTDRNITPIIDAETGSIHTRENQVNNDVSEEGAAYNITSSEWEYPDAYGVLTDVDNLTAGFASSGGSGLSRYITKDVVLNNASEDLRVILAVNKPASGSNIHVYAKRKPSDELQKSLQEIDWYKMAILSVDGDVNASEIPVNQFEDNFVEVEFILPSDDPTIAVNDPIPPITLTNGTTQGGFTEFTIKVVFTSNEKAKVCKIKNLSAIASI